MSQFNSKQLLTILRTDLTGITNKAQALYGTLETLNSVPLPGKWTIAQVIEHLNTYNDYYLPEIEKRMEAYGGRQVPLKFSTGLIGGYLTKMMQPDASGKVTNKTKAFKKHIPVVELDARSVLHRFFTGQERFLKILQNADQYDLNKVRVKMSLSSMIRLKLGDILRVLVIHQQRHFIQIAEAAELIGQQQKANA